LALYNFFYLLFPKKVYKRGNFLCKKCTYRQIWQKSMKKQWMDTEKTAEIITTSILESSANNNNFLPPWVYNEK